ncbi:UDP-glucuronosyltransferase 1-8-like isoform X2 [Acanthaster planci]|uniref:UDP-glucuronosyltransferase 1-8-like isoform X2 n=1 Tax=Acanthaster planci TaxID=133434 RepID=A0A8B7YZ74_ACAPL|nr:UDP-glucuronosyltransferase 1-8-like isoform X2 [Acanthaster planci]XP_022098654.1 UDP-glucuronosyltransferase 1-8-like isoform X2 [Acanthaster planci]
MTALEEVAYWVEYAVRHGTDHLKPRAMQLSFVQYYLLDVIAITVVIVTIMCWCVVNVGRCLFRGFTPPVEWQSFVDGAGEHGIVIMALGTLISDELTDQQAESIASSLALLSQKVAWSYSGKLPKTLGNNTKVVKWLPQNDLLGHPKTRAFISHGGLNSIHQCIYHAVPMVGIPVFGDQKDNFIRLGAKGMSVLLDIHQLTERSIYDATVEIIYNETYKEAVQRYSAIARDRVTPMTALEEVAYWVEYAVRHGTDHLKPRAMQLSFVQYYLLDVIAITVVIVTIMCWCVVNVGRCLFRGFTPPVVRVPGIPVS